MRNLIFAFMLFTIPLWGDSLYLQNGTVIEGEIVKLSETAVEIRTQLGQQIVQRNDILRIYISGEALPQVQVKTTYRYYLIPVCASLAFLAADMIADADRLDAEIRRRERYGQDAGDLKSHRTRKYVFGILSGVASAATLAFVFDGVDVAVLPNQIQVGVRL